jgi:ETC complex I subunit conserved region
MDDGRGRNTAPAWRGDNQGRGPGRLPGTSLPARGPLPVAYIHQPAPSPTQAGRARTREWLLEFEPSSRHEIEPLMGWASSRDPFAHIRLRFPDRQSAIEFAEKQGWPYAVQDPPMRRFRPKSYADNFRYDLADAITRAERRWDGAVSAADRPGAERPHLTPHLWTSAPPSRPGTAAGGGA